MESGVFTLLLTDLVQSTRLAVELGEERAASVFAAHDRLARALLAEHGGREIERTDGFLFLFARPAAAAACALAYQRALAELPRAYGVELRARTALHHAPIGLLPTDPADVARGARPVDVHGVSIAVAARLLGLAQPGQTLLSPEARQALAPSGSSASALAAAGPPEPASGRDIRSHGHYRMKGLPEPLEVFEIGDRDSCPFTPPADAEKAYRVVRAGDLWQPARAVPHVLPAEADAFVGREHELSALALRLEQGARLVTVVGPAGVGKTRFARRLAWSRLGDWPQGAWMCALGEARTVDGIAYAVAGTLDVPLGQGDPVAQLGHAIAARGRCLIVLDELEQAVAHAAATVGRWLERAPEAVFLVTSRERLHLPGEQVFPLEPLELEREAVELFALRARAQRPDFAPGDADRAQVAHIVRMLDGLPLAIELAAARLSLLSPAQLLERLNDRFRLLASGRGGSTRQATLRAAIDGSWDLLTAAEKAALAQCSVFEGGFTLEAAEAVLDLGRPATGCVAGPPEVMDALQALVDKSLLYVSAAAPAPAPTAAASTPAPDAGDGPRFRFLSSLHEYAAGRLAGGDETDGHRDGAEATAADAAPAAARKRRAEERHGGWYARLGSDEALVARTGHGGAALRRALARDLDNLLAACRRAIARGDGETATATFRAAWDVFEMRGPFAAGVELGRAVLALSGLAPGTRARTLLATANACRLAGQTRESEALFEEALALLRPGGDVRMEGIVLRNLAILDGEQGRTERARDRFGEATARSEAAGDRHNLAAIYGNLALIDVLQGRAADARVLLERAIAAHRELGNRRAEAIVLGFLGNLEQEQGRAEAGARLLEQALAIHRELADRRFEGVVLSNLGIQHIEQRDFERARSHFERALAIHRAIGNRRSEGAAIANLAALALDLGRHDEALRLEEQALAIHRETGNRRHEGVALKQLARMLARDERFDEARAHLVAGERLLHEVGDRLELAKLLCARGELECAAGDLAAAAEALRQARPMAASFDAAPGSAIGRALGALESRIAAARAQDPEPEALRGTEELPGGAA